MVGCAMQKFDLWELTCQYPHILDLVPNRKSRLGADFYQLIVVEICQNTCKSCDKMMQLLQNHSISHHTDSQCSLISFLWFWEICGSTALVGFQLSHVLDKILEINNFCFFVPGAQSNKGNKILQAETWPVTIKLLP